MSLIGQSSLPNAVCPVVGDGWATHVVLYHVIIVATAAELSLFNSMSYV